MAAPPSRSGRERRQYPRAEAAWPLEIRLADGPHGARLRDVSRAGVCFFLDRAIPPMTVLDLALEVALDGRAQRIAGRGAVVRCERISPSVEHYEVAVFLHEMTESARALLDRFVMSARPAAEGVKPDLAPEGP
ncbi:MAG TPA: PilZ domain-containing protein [Planctomycetota bacterium]|nr:PilZ domain-containing protein [Planctomycetota bacterium]